jgi:hypothetical protein
MVIRIERGTGGHEREVPFSPTVLTALREYYRWMRPLTYLFPGQERREGRWLAALRARLRRQILVDAATIVTRDTAILRWHRTLIAWKWTYPKRRRGAPARL